MSWRMEQLRSAAENPASSIEDLLQAATHFPRLVIANPTFLVELVMDPGVLHKLSTAALIALAGCENVPEAVLDYGVTRLAKDPRNMHLFNSLMCHRRLSGRTAQRAAEIVKPEDDTDEAGKYHRHVYRGSLQEPTLEHIRRQLTANRGLRGVRASLEGLGLHNAFATQAALRYGKGTGDRTAERVAVAPFAAPSVLAYMFQAPEYQRWRGQIARNPNAPSGVLMAALERGEVKLIEMADRPGLTEGAQRELLLLRDPDVDYALAGNPSLGEDEQFELIKNGEKRALARLALLRNLAPKVEYYLAALQDPEICRTLLRRPHLGAAALEEMTHSHHAVIAMLARDYKPTPEEYPPMVYQYRARFEKQGPGRLEQLIIATSSNVEPEILADLATSIEAAVRLAVAAHPATPTATRLWLADDPDVRVAKAAQEEPVLPL